MIKPGCKKPHWSSKDLDVPLDVNKWLGSMGYNLLRNGIYWGYNLLILTFDPNFLGHPSRSSKDLVRTYRCDFGPTNPRLPNSHYSSYFILTLGEKTGGFWKTTRCAPTRWAPTSYKWSYKPYKWPCKWVTGVITLLIGVITPFITSRGPTLY